jgi:hypothetical protein
LTWEVGYDERGLKRGGSYSARKGQIGKMRGVGERRTLQDVALMDVPNISYEDRRKTGRKRA